jgi:nitroreductase
MDVMEAIHGRRSVREFAIRSVDRTVLLRLIDAAVCAPSAFDEQPWHFTVVQNQQKLDTMSSHAKAHLLAAQREAMPSYIHEMLRNPSFQIFYHAPVLIVVSARPGGPWTVEDCALAAENLMLAACAEGLGSCWIGFAQGWLQTRDGRRALGLPVACLPVAPIVVGHAASTPPPVPRKEAQIRWIE